MIILLCDNNSMIIIINLIKHLQIQIHRYGKYHIIEHRQYKKNNSCELFKKFMEELDETRDIGSGEEG